MSSLNTSISTSLQNNSTREWIYYFDVMKGIGMVLVVLGHVMLFTFGIEPPQAGKFLYFHMPLFFYISGFLAYKQFDNIKVVGKRFLTRGLVLLVPYIIFLSLYNIFAGKSSEIIHNLFAGGGRYWFLYDLFILSSFFLLYEYCLRNIKKDWIYICLFLLPLIILIAAKYTISRLNFLDSDVNSLQSIITGLVNYYRYFLIGYLCKKYIIFNNFLFKNSIVCALGFLAYFVAWYFYDLHNIALIFMGTLGALIVLQWFVINYMPDNSKWTKLWIYIGRCSLGIYVIHYFFIPDLSNLLHPYMQCVNPFVWQISLGLLITIPIVAASIFTYKLIEMNRWLYMLFFGKIFKR